MTQTKSGRDIISARRALVAELETLRTAAKASLSKESAGGTNEEDMDP